MHQRTTVTFFAPRTKKIDTPLPANILVRSSFVNPFLSTLARPDLRLWSFLCIHLCKIHESSATVNVFTSPRFLRCSRFGYTRMIPCATTKWFFFWTSSKNINEKGRWGENVIAYRFLLRIWFVVMAKKWVWSYYQDTHIQKKCFICTDFNNHSFQKNPPTRLSAQ